MSPLHQSWLWAALVGLTFTGPRVVFAQRAAVEAEPVYIRTVHQVIEIWRPESQLFVKGDIGVGSRQLKELSEWLWQNGKHWTVVLLETAAGEAFEARDGRVYADMDAVEHALGYGLSNRTGFGTLEHPVTREKDGAIFVLFLRERKFSYFSSDAQDRRGLGQSQWIGNLDQPAFRAMRSGGRIVDAVKDTVKSIEMRLNQAIQAEAEAVQRAEAEQRRAIEFLKEGLRTAEASIVEVEAKAAAFRNEFASATGPLAKPAVAEWRQQLKAIASQLTPDKTRSNEQSLAKVADEIARYLNAYAGLAGFSSQKARLESRLAALSDSPNDVARGEIEKARRIIGEAEAKSRAGELDFAESMLQAEKSVAAGDRLIVEEKARLEQVRLRRLWIRGTVIAMLALLGLATAIFLWILNRRRRTTMEAAKKAFGEREQSVRRETDHLDKLFQRNGEILGSREKVVERGYTGRTREVSEQALSYVDDLFIMSKEVNRVMEDARELIFPTSLFGKLTNLFSSNRYLQGINHLSGTPLRFTRRGGLPWILRNKVARDSDGDGKISEAELPDEVSLTFDEIYRAFKERGVDAQSSLSKLEDSLANVHEALDDLQQKLEKATQREQKLAMAAEQDGYFGTPKYVEVLLPSVQSDLAEADRLSTFDAVQAMDGPIPSAGRKLSDADRLSTLLDSARQELFPKLKRAAEELKAYGYTSDWIDRALDEITQQADQMIELAAKESIDAGIANVGNTFSDLETNLNRCVELAKAIQDEYSPGLKKLEGRIAEVRSELGRALELPSESLLRELDREPDDHLSRAKDNLEAAKTMLLQGRSEAAAAAVDTMQMENAKVDFILRASKEAVDTYTKSLSANQESLEQLHRRMEKLSGAIGEAKQKYAGSALMVRCPTESIDAVSAPSRAKIGEGLHPSHDAGPTSQGIEGEILPGMKKTAERLLSEVAGSMQDIRRLLELAQSEHQQGQILKGADRIKGADRDLKRALSILAQIEEHLAKLESQSQANLRRQEACERMLSDIQNESRDAKVTSRTLQAIEQVASSVRLNRQELETTRTAPNPFESAKVVELAYERLEELKSQIVADRQGYAEASRAVVGAERQLETAKQYVQRSQSDGIADSQLTIQLNQKIAQYARQLDGVRHALNVPHGDWQSVDDDASQLQSSISEASRHLSDELQVAHQALQAFEQASQSVFRAEHWSGAGGGVVIGSPGVHELELARVALQSGNYRGVLDLSRTADRAAQIAIQQAEREIALRRMEEARAAEMARRAREAARRQRTSGRDFGGGFGDIFSGGFGGGIGGGFSGGSGGHSGGGSSRGGGSSSSGGSSGFSRSGW